MAVTKVFIVKTNVFASIPIELIAVSNWKMITSWFPSLLEILFKVYTTLQVQPIQARCQRGGAGGGALAPPVFG